ncbi:hypothetical protein R1sor_003928 [Riccia sorocarpa]|uniref:RNA helicase n=1 Tax=Riccia sorocarpa TaxID=122646 RepID=A0ABD3H578_9MARC
MIPAFERGGAPIAVGVGLRGSELVECMRRSHRRLLRREDLQRLHKKATNDGVFTQAVDAFSEVADCAARRGFSATLFSKVWHRSSVLSVFERFFTSGSGRCVQSKLVHPCISSERRVFRSSSLHPGMELPVKSRSRELPVRSSSREFSWYAATQQYSDDEGEDENAEAFSFDNWRRRLRRLVAGDQQELISKDKRDRREFSHLAPLLKSLGLHGQIYAKTIVISKLPLPYYRPDLDEKRPQMALVVRPDLRDTVDSGLRKHVMEKKEYPSSVSLSYSNDDSDEEENVLLEGKENSAPGANIATIEPRLIEERRRRRSIWLKNRQRSLQESPEGQKILSFRKSLPAYKERGALLEALSKHQVIVVSGETGCGKTTQLPQYILESEIAAGRGSDCRIICTQPRRISAVSVAERVAAERGEEIGDTVGYQVRLDGQRSKDTRLLFCTSGILLRRLMSDPELTNITHVLVDEIHERGMNEDFLLIVLKNLLSRRPDLKLVLMSATLNAELFSAYFDRAPMLHIPGFTYPVRSYFLEDVLQETGHHLTAMNQIDDYGHDKQWRMQKQMRGRSRKNQVSAIAEAALAKQDYSNLPYRVRDSILAWNPESLNFNLIEKLLAHICKQDKEGAVLVFMTGMEDISALLDQLKEHPVLGDTEKVMLLPCHGSMATSEQKLIFNHAPAGVRKIVLATNMAETSITINDVVFVVDCGKAKESSYDALNNTPCLLPQWISQASARQRRGRAGRVKPGVTYHLYPRAVYEALDQYQQPELLRTPLHAICLTIKSLGLDSIEEFLGKALQPPEERAVHNAVELLKTIGALNDREALTDLGRHLSKLPVEPKLGKMLIMGSIFGCLEPVLTIAAGLSVRDPFVVPAEKKEMADEAKLKFAGDDGSDHLALVRAFDGWMRAHKQGKGSEFCWQNFLSSQTLQSMLQMRRQFCSNLAEAGFDTSRNGEYSKDLDLIRGVICSGLFPGVASAVQRSRSITFKTKDDGQVNLHQGSVNGREQQLRYPWLVFNEKVKTSSVNIRDSTGISDSILLLFGGELTRGSEPGHLLMLDGYLEFFTEPEVASTILMLREELDELIQKKLEDPKLDIHQEGPYLIQAVLALLHGDQCEGRFVFGRKASVKKDRSSPEPLEDVKGQLQQLVQRGGRAAPRYKTKGVARGAFQSTVLVKGKTFLGKPASSKKQAEKNASRVALEWVLHSQTLSDSSPDRATPQRLPLQEVEVNRDLGSGEAALTQFQKAKDSRRRKLKIVS